MSDDAIRITLPLIVGLCITTPLYIIGDITNYNFLVLSSIPMMGGAVVSGILSLRSAKQDEVELRKINPLILKGQTKTIIIGVLIGVTPLIVFTWYVLSELL